MLKYNVVHILRKRAIKTKTINLNDTQVVVLKSLLKQEKTYLKEAIKEAEDEDKKDLEEELNACVDILNQLK